MANHGRGEAEAREKIRADLAEKARKKKNLENLMLALWMFVLVVAILAISGFGLYLFLENR